jgi:hypothetical protein
MQGNSNSQYGFAGLPNPARMGLDLAIQASKACNYDLSRDYKKSPAQTGQGILNFRRNIL